MLLEKGADVNVQDVHWATPLHDAIGSLEHNVEIVQLLMEKKPNLKLKNKHDYTPLAWAQYYMESRHEKRPIYRKIVEILTNAQNNENEN